MRLLIFSLLGLIVAVHSAILSGSRASDAYIALLKNYDKRAQPDGKRNIKLLSLILKANRNDFI